MEEIKKSAGLEQVVEDNQELRRVIKEDFILYQDLTTNAKFMISRVVPRKIKIICDDAVGLENSQYDLVHSKGKATRSFTQGAKTKSKGHGFKVLNLTLRIFVTVITRVYQE